MGTYIDGLWYADDQVETGRDGELRPKAGFTHPALLPMPALLPTPPAQAGDEGAKDVAADESETAPPPGLDAPSDDGAGAGDAVAEVEPPTHPAPAGDEGAKERDPVRLDKQRHPVTRDKGAFGGR